MRAVTPWFIALAIGASASVPASALAADTTKPSKPFTCEASAIRGSVLGQPAVEPVVANRGSASCKTVTQGGNLPAPLTAGVISATTSLTGPADRIDKQTAFSAGGIVNLALPALPNLGITLPTTQLADTLGAVSIPLPTQVANDLLNGVFGALPPVPGVTGTGGIVSGGTTGGTACTVNLLGVCIRNAQTRAGVLPTSITVDLRPALQALLPNGGLPNVNLLEVGGAVAFGAATCSNGKPVMSGSTQVASVRVLGQTLPTDTAVSQAISLLDTTSIDPKKIDLSKVVLPAGITLPTATLQAILAPVLAALPPISIPAAVAQVTVTPSSQSTADDVLTQNGPRVRVSLLGQSLLDLTLGEAKVGTSGVDCAVPAAAPAAATTGSQTALECTTRRLVLTDVIERNGRVRLTGAADKALRGKTVAITFHGKTVARVKVGSSGSFATSASLPPKAQRGTNGARYQAKVGKEKSLDLKLQRRMIVSSTKVTKSTVTIKGRVSRPLGSPIQTITLQRRVSCKKLETVKRFKPKSDGTFSVTVPKPSGKGAVVYRLGTKVRNNPGNPKLFPTFTLPRAVTLG